MITKPTQRFQSWLLRSRPFLVFPAVIGGLIAWLAIRGKLSAGSVLGGAAIGLFAWTLVEWVFHRAMHLHVRSGWLARFQDDAHLRHHREPEDLDHSVLRLRGSIPLAIMFFAIAWGVAGNSERAAAFMIGLLFGYLLYEFVHLASHARRKMRWMQPLIAYHARHHYQSQDRTFGVTSPIWDWVFGTLPRSAHSRINTPAVPSNQPTNV